MIMISAKRKNLISVALLTVAVLIGVVIFWPTDSGERKAEFKRAAFLDHRSRWADSLAEQLSLDDAIRQILIWNGGQGDVRGGYGGYLFKGQVTPDSLYDNMRRTAFLGAVDWLDQVVDSTVTIRHYLATDLRYQHLVDSSYKVRWKQLGFTMDMRMSNAVWMDNNWEHSSEMMTPYLGGRGADTAGGKRISFSGALGYSGDSIISTRYLAEIADSAWYSGGVALLFRPFDLVDAVTKKPVRLNEVLRKQGIFEGLLIADCRDLEKNNFLKAWHHGASMFIFEGQPDLLIGWLKGEMASGKITEKEIRERVHRVLLARSWLGLEEPVIREVGKIDVGFKNWITSRVLESSVALLKNTSGILPFPLMERPSVALFSSFNLPTKVHRAVSFYHAYTKGNFTGNPAADLNVIFVGANDSLTDEQTEGMRRLLASNHAVLIYAGRGTNDHLTKEARSLIWCQGTTEKELSAAVQIVFGGLPATGKAPTTLVEIAHFGDGIELQQQRIGFADPIDVGMSADSLRKIDYIANEAISAGAFPGCQVIALKDGRVVYQKNFGYLDYAKRSAVKTSTLYDLASVTKVAATTLMAMKLYEMNKFRLDDRLESYFPDTLKKHLHNGRSTLADLSWKELLTHRSGLPAGINVYKYMSYIDTATGRYDRFFCDLSDDSMFCVEVAKNYYLEAIQLDSIWWGLHHIRVDQRKEYVYSDINANLLFIMMKRILQQLEPQKARRKDNHFHLAERWNASLYENKLRELFYAPLGMKSTMFLPLRQFDPGQIAPTSNDQLWRKQTLQGHVHDPTAAIFGGIAGSAGLFSTSADMAVLFQMLLFKGQYGGKRYLDAESVELFTRKQDNGHRGLGFNKPAGEGLFGIPEQASLSTFGHTGYTGNSVWADPENSILYILLSNRSHPKGDNPKIISLGIQGRMHRAIYDACIYCE